MVVCERVGMCTPLEFGRYMGSKFGVSLNDIEYRRSWCSSCVSFQIVKGFEYTSDTSNSYVFGLFDLS